MDARRQVEQIGRATDNHCMVGVEKLDLDLHASGDAAIVDSEITGAFLALAHIEDQVLAQNAHDCSSGTIRCADGIAGRRIRPLGAVNRIGVGVCARTAVSSIASIR